MQGNKNCTIVFNYSHVSGQLVSNINSLMSTVLVQGNPLHRDVSRIIINWDMINNICTSYKNKVCDKAMMVLIFCLWCNQCSVKVAGTPKAGVNCLWSV